MTSVKLLRQGDKGPSVTKLQKALVAEGYGPFTPLGTFGPVTHRAVIAFQKSKGLIVDGIVGHKTQLALNLTTQAPVEGSIQEADIIEAAESISVDPVLLKAFSEVETKNTAFFKDTIPAMLYERHVMRRQLLKRDLDLLVKIAIKERPDLVNSVPGGYRGGLHEHTRLMAAAQLNKEAAYESASYGRYQIMGFHWESLGFSSALDFYSYMQVSEHNQLKALIRFIRANTSLLRAMRTLNFKVIAELYNGHNYAINQYDVKLEDAYNRLKQIT